MPFVKIITSLHMYSDLTLILTRKTHQPLYSSPTFLQRQQVHQVYILLIGMFCQRLYVPTTDTWYEQSAMGNYLTEVVLALDITRKVMELSVNYNECGATTKDATQLGFLQDVSYFLVDIYNYFNHLVQLFTMEYNFREVLTTSLSFSRGGLLIQKEEMHQSLTRLNPTLVLLYDECNVTDGWIIYC